MILFYIRHGEPIYEPDSLTQPEEKQSESIGRRLALYGVDKIYSSTSNRAIQTARPLCELLEKEAVLLDFCNEKYTIEEFCVERDRRKNGFFGISI